MAEDPWRRRHGSFQFFGSRIPPVLQRTHVQENSSRKLPVRDRPARVSDGRCRFSTKPSGKGTAGEALRGSGAHRGPGQDGSLRDQRRGRQHAAAFQREWTDPRRRQASRQLPGADVAGEEAQQALGHARPGSHRHGPSRESHRQHRAVPRGGCRDHRAGECQEQAARLPTRHRENGATGHCLRP